MALIPFFGAAICVLICSFLDPAMLSDVLNQQTLTIQLPASSLVRSAVMPEQTCFLRLVPSVRWRRKYRLKAGQGQR